MITSLNLQNNAIAGIIIVIISLFQLLNVSMNLYALTIVNYHI